MTVLLVAPPLAVSAFAAAWLTGRGHPRVAVAVEVAQAGWAALVGGLYTLADLWSAGNVGWGMGLVTFGAGAVLLLAAWLAEDALARGR